MAENKYEPQPGKGRAWKNDNKTEDWHADWRGKMPMPACPHCGNEHERWMDVWDAPTKKGIPSRTVRLGNVVENQAPTHAEPAPTPNPTNPPMDIEEFTDDIPF